MEVKMLEGSAIYDVKKGSSLAINAPVLRNAPAAPKAVAQGAPRQAAAPVEYRMVAQSSSAGSNTGLVIVPKAISSGSFIAADNRNVRTTPGTGTRIILPNRTILEVTSNTDGTYTINKINIPIENPAGGPPIYITPDTQSPLIGASVTIGSEPNEASLNVTLPGVGRALTPQELGGQIGTDTELAFLQTQAQLPAGAQMPSSNPISSGTFAPATVVSPPGT